MKWIVRFAASLGFLMVLVTATPILRSWNAALSSRWGYDSGETLIVLGQDITGPDMLGLGSYWRSFYAVLVWREHRFHRIVVTGKDVAPLMRGLMINQGVPADAITVENAANSTRENAVFTANLLRGAAGRSVILTSDYHSGRALRAFRKAGIEATALPFPDAGKRLNSWKDRWSVFLILAEETVKVVYYDWKGWT